MRRQLLPALVMMIVFTVLLGLVYPLVITGIAVLGFNDKAEGALIKVDGQVVGSKWIGQVFTDPKYFPTRARLPTATCRAHKAAACTRTGRTTGR